MLDLVCFKCTIDNITHTTKHLYTHRSWMMPSLYCKLDCPHCYLTKEQRRSKDCLSLEQIKITVEKINIQ
jgi:sulfatase maturation enzyme AslB (radical SAM superfamily)